MYMQSFIDRQVEIYSNRRNNFVGIIVDKVLTLAAHPTGKKVLDLGCGIGTQALEFARYGNTCIGIDNSPLCISKANELTKKLNLDCKFVGGLLGHDPLPENDFDIIVAISIAEHMFDNDLKKLFQQCYKILKDDGEFILEAHPTRYDYIFYDIACFPLLGPFLWLPDKLFKKYVHILDSTWVQFIWKCRKGVTRKQKSLTWEHCNLLTLGHLKELLSKAGFVFEKVVIENNYPPHDDRYYSKTILSSLYCKLVEFLFKEKEYFKREIYIVCKKNK